MGLYPGMGPSGCPAQGQTVRGGGVEVEIGVDSTRGPCLIVPRAPRSGCAVMSVACRLHWLSRSDGERAFSREGGGYRVLPMTYEEDPMSRMILALSLLTMVVACAPEGGEQARFFFPDGDPDAGRAAFSAMQCYACHHVIGDDFPDPHATPPLEVSLGPEIATLSRGAIAESIIAPSHGITAEFEQVLSGELSRMGDYSEAMTVRQFIDIVAYLEWLGSQ